MRLLPSILFAILIFTLAACNPNRIFEEHNSNFPDNRWQKDNAVKFTFRVEDTLSEHKLSVALRHVYGYQFTTMKIFVDITPPSGTPTTKGYELKVMSNGAYLSECSGDICDLEVLIEDHVKFIEPGDWIFTIHCDMDMPYVPNVMEFGLLIDKYPTGE